MKKIFCLVLLLFTTLFTSCMFGEEGEKVIKCSDAETFIKYIKSRGGTKLELTSDIDLSNYESLSEETYRDQIVIRIEGNNFTIRNVDLKPECQMASIFPMLAYGSELSNLNFDNCKVEAYRAGIVSFDSEGAVLTNVHITNSTVINSGYGGGFFAFAQSTSLFNCSFNGTIDSKENVGGLIGQVYNCSANSCKVSGSIKGTKSIGGMFGRLDCFNAQTGAAYNISLCENSAEITGEEIIGGIIGTNYTAANLGILQYDGGTTTSIEECVNKGNIIATGDKVGGIIGFGSRGLKNVSKCTNEGKIVGGTNVGGIQGFSEDGFISHCENEGEVNGKIYVGGIAGRNQNIENCNNSGNITSDSTSNDSYCGGIVGKGEGVIGCNNSGDITGNRNKVGGIVGFSEAVVIVVALNGDGKICDNINSGRISGYSDVGGIIGYYKFNACDRDFIGNQNTGDICASYSSVGSFIGTIEMIANVAASGSFNMKNCEAKCDLYGYQNVAAFIGYALRNDNLFVSNKGGVKIHNCKLEGTIYCDIEDKRGWFLPLNSNIYSESDNILLVEFKPYKDPFANN